MRRSMQFLMGLIVAGGLLGAGCSQAAPAPVPTAAPAAQPKAAEPTKPPAVAAFTPAPAPTNPAAVVAAPTATVAKKVDFPAGGKAVSVIVPYAAGGATDVAARLLASRMEKELGAAVQVVNKPGGGSQTGLTELAKSKPDGYTLGYTVLPTVNTTYLDPERKATYTQKDFQPVVGQYTMPVVVSVKDDSPYKSLKDLVDAVKANPSKIKAGNTGLLGTAHLGILQMQKIADAKFAIVQFDGGAPEMTALLGGHIDVAFNVVSEVMAPVKAGQIRPLAVLSKQECKFLPDVKTAEAQGYPAYIAATGGISGPAGTPKDVVEALSAAAKRSIDTDEHKKKMDELGFTLNYLNPDQFSSAWMEVDEQTKPLIVLAR